MKDIWTKIGPGRYEASYQGHILSVVRNPDYPQDSRRYQPVVNHQSVDTPKSGLKTAQTAAINHVLRAVIDPPKERVPSLVTGRPVETLYADFTEVPDPVPEPRRDFTFQMRGTVHDGDVTTVLAALRTTLELLREHSRVECTVTLPPEITL